MPLRSPGLGWALGGVKQSFPDLLLLLLLITNYYITESQCSGKISRTIKNFLFSFGIPFPPLGRTLFKRKSRESVQRPTTSARRAFGAASACCTCTIQMSKRSLRRGLGRLLETIKGAEFSERPGVLIENPEIL